MLQNTYISATNTANLIPLVPDDYSEELIEYTLNIRMWICVDIHLNTQEHRLICMNDM